MDDKRTVRSKYKSARAALSESYRQEASSVIAGKVFGLCEYKNAGKVFVYESLSTEVATNGIIARCFEDGKLVAVPVTGENGRMDFAALARKSPEGKTCGDYVTGRTRVVTPDEDTLIIVPGVAFDDDLNRTGFGGGYYDRYLSGHAGFRAGIAFEAQIAQKLPAEGHDVRMDIVITEKNTYR